MKEKTNKIHWWNTPQLSGKTRLRQFIIFDGSRPEEAYIVECSVDTEYDKLKEYVDKRSLKMTEITPINDRDKKSLIATYKKFAVEEAVNVTPQEWVNILKKAYEESKSKNNWGKEGSGPLEIYIDKDSPAVKSFENYVKEYNDYINESPNDFSGIVYRWYGYDDVLNFDDFIDFYFKEGLTMSNGLSINEAISALNNKSKLNEYYERVIYALRFKYLDKDEEEKFDDTYMYDTKKEALEDIENELEWEWEYNHEEGLEYIALYSIMGSIDNSRLIKRYYLPETNPDINESLKESLNEEYALAFKFLDRQQEDKIRDTNIGLSKSEAIDRIKDKLEDDQGDTIEYIALYKIYLDSEGYAVGNYRLVRRYYAPGISWND